MPDPVVMAFDQSPCHTGWAIGRPRDVKPLFGEFTLPSWGNAQEHRLEAIYDFCLVMFAKHGITHASHEEPVPAAGMGRADFYVPKSGKNAGQLKTRVVNQKDPSIQFNQDATLAMIWLACRKAHIPVTQQSINHVRTFFNGRCRVTGLQGEHHTKQLKQDSIDTCTRLGLMVGRNDNIAEAIAHLHYKLHSLDRHHQSWLAGQKNNITLRMWEGTEAA